MIRSFLAGAAFALTAACATPGGSVSPEANARASGEILALLEQQDEAWNRGDIDGFMEGYWVSPDLRFASGGDVTRGYSETLARYKQRYASRALMGTLDTSEHEIVVLAPDAAIAHGRWQLTRDNDTPGGLYTLVLRKIGGEWKIVSDTTTSAD